MEDILTKEFIDLREKGLKVTGYWFKCRAKQIMKDMEPSSKFSASDGWFTPFKSRHCMSLRRPINTSQKAASDKEESIQTFHYHLRKLAALTGDDDELKDVGRFCLHQIPIWTRLPYHSALLMEQHTTRLEVKLYGCVVLCQDSINDNIQSNLRFLPMEFLE